MVLPVLVVFAFPAASSIRAAAAPANGVVAADIELTRDVRCRIAPLIDDKPGAWADEVVFQKAGGHRLICELVLEAPDPARFVALRIGKPHALTDLTLNGKPVPMPIEGMLYDRLPGVPPDLLREGENELRGVFTVQVQQRTDKTTGKAYLEPASVAGPKVSVHGQLAAALALQTGPILGHAGTDFFTVTCRTNMPAAMVLLIDGRPKSLASKAGLMHAWRIDGLTPDTAYRYQVVAILPGAAPVTRRSGPHTVRTMPTGDKLCFVALGDARTHPKDWALVAAAVVGQKPAFSVFVGDMVTHGRYDDQWDTQYVGPAKEYFATIPYYAVIGNHERNAPVFLKLFQTPNGTKNWSQRIGPALLIGTDGEMDWSEGGELVKWLEGLLAATDAKFVFLATHYPAWSSGSHGRLGADGLPREKTVRTARTVIMPLLKKYNVTAFLAGHDHFYERSEPPDGVSHIIIGGAGAPLRDRVANPEKQNPHGKVFAKALHYCLFTIDGDTCTLKALTPAGSVIDERTWKARR